MAVCYAAEVGYMPDSFSIKAQQGQAMAAARELQQCNTLSERYGLSLSENQIQALVQARFESLRYAGRMELGGGVLPKLVYAFCDSPYITRDDYADTLMVLQELFYTFKNESEDSLSDDELMEALKRIFDNRAQGSLEYLENLTVSDLYRALRGQSDGYEEEDNDE